MASCIHPGFGITCAGAIAEIKGQEIGNLTREARGHVDFIRIHGKMYESSFLELKDKVIGVTVVHDTGRWRCATSGRS